MKVISDKPFSDKLHAYLKASGQTQEKLAKAIGLHHKVLSRKLLNYKGAYLTEEEVWHIIFALVRWKAIISQDEVLRFLKLAGLELESDSYSAKQWQALPLRAETYTSIHASYSLLPYPQTTQQHNLPAVTTPLIGREELVYQLRQMINVSETRLLTLIGPGGCGKTRLALKVARELTHTFSQGVWFVPLASVRNPLLVPQTIMQTLDIRPIPDSTGVQSLITYLRNKHVLLLLDNFEHISEAAIVVSELLAALPLLKVIVTSRGRLRLNGERVFDVPPLDYPSSSTGLELRELAHYGAIKLFVDRARAIQHNFTLTSENVESVRQICELLDGLPLAIELAAARVKVWSPERLVGLLKKARLSLLTDSSLDLPERHKTLSKTIAWSYELLSPNEQVWFARLGIFNGGLFMTAVEAMMHTLETPRAESESGSIVVSALDLLVRLLDTSLLMRVPVTGGQMRFALLETIREYALEQLKANQEYERLRNWHACYYLTVAEAGAIGLHGSQQLMWRARLVANRDNFRSALAWSLRQARESISTVIGNAIHFTGEAFGESQETPEGSGDEAISFSTSGSTCTSLLAIDVVLRMASALRPYWEWQGHLVEGRRWLEAALALPIPEDAPQSTRMARAKALSECSRVLSIQNEQERSGELVDESIALWRQLDQPEGLATALWYRGWGVHALGNYERSREGYEEALQLLTSSGDLWLRAQILFYLGDALGFLGEFEQMHAHFAQCLALFEQVGDQSAIADVLKDQGGMLILQGRLAQAIDNLLRSLDLSYKLGHKQFVSTGTNLLGFAVGMREEPDAETATLQAALLWGASEGLQEAIGSGSWLDTYPVAYAMRQQILSRISESSWRSAWQSGRALTEDQIVAACMALRREPVGARG